LPNAIYNPERHQNYLGSGPKTSITFQLENICLSFTEVEKFEDAEHCQKKVVEYYRSFGFQTGDDDFGAGFSLRIIGKFSNRYKSKVKTWV